MNFTPDQVRAVAAGTADRRTVMSVLTSQTCGEACWHAREEICRCSCGGANHGCLNHGGAQPDRTAKIDGERYRLIAVGTHSDLYREAWKLNRANFKSIEPATKCENDGEAWFHQYRYTWQETDSGAPARLKSASKEQLSKWLELAGWKDQRGIYLLWENLNPPPAPTEKIVDKKTGEPLPEEQQHPKL